MCVGCISEGTLLSSWGNSATSKHRSFLVPAGELHPVPSHRSGAHKKRGLKSCVA